MTSIKKITSILAGLSLLGATIYGAVAQNLQDYPNQFIRDNEFNGFFVTGAEAQQSDITAAVDIAQSLPIRAGQNATGRDTRDQAGQNVTFEEGMAWEVRARTNALEIANNNAPTVSGESIAEIVPFIDVDDLDVLQDGTWQTLGGSFNYEQLLAFDRGPLANTSRIVKFAENDEDQTGLFFFIADGQQIARYNLKFITAAESDIVNNNLDEFEESTLELMGREFTVVEATRPAGQNSLSLTLLGGAVEDRLDVGEAQSYTIDDTNYEVELTFVDSNRAQFTVNGQRTRLLREGDTQTLQDGTQIGVNNILFQNIAGGIQAVTFFLGAQELELQDDDVTDTTGTFRIESEGEEVQGTTVIIRGSDNNNLFTISNIDVEMTAEDDYYIPIGGSLREAIRASGDDVDVLFPGNWDFRFRGLTEAETHELQLHAPAADRYDLDLFDGNGNRVHLPIAFAEGANDLTMGRRSVTQPRNRQERLVLNESENIGVNDYFVLTTGSPEAGTAESFLLQYQRGDDTDRTGARIRFRDIGSGRTIEEPISTTGATIATIRIGGAFFDVFNATATTEEDFEIRVALNGDGDVTDTAFIPFVDNFGSQWELLQVEGDATAANPDQFFWRMSVPNENEFDTVPPRDVFLRIQSEAGEVRADFAGMDLISPRGETNVRLGYNSLGAQFRYTTEVGEPQELTIRYPEEQILPNLFLVAGEEIEVPDGEDGVVPIDLQGLIRTDEEITDITAQNLIVVGGPCVNSVAAELLGMQDVVGDIEQCTQGFTPGEARIQMFEHANGNVAMLVAGYSGQDTLLAAQMLADRADELQGESVVVSGSNVGNAVIRRDAGTTTPGIGQGTRTPTGTDITS